jgi:hypothetical protein
MVVFMLAIFLILFSSSILCMDNKIFCLDRCAGLDDTFSRSCSCRMKE